MTMTDYKVTKIFFLTDEFSKKFYTVIKFEVSLALWKELTK